jgi:DNA-binding beta-propeller fold protein YncE
MVALCVAIAAAAVPAAYLWHTASGPAVSHPQPRDASQLAVVSRVHLGRGATHLAAGYGGVWVIRLGVVYRVDPATSKTVATIPVPGAGLWSTLATGAGAVWVTRPGDHPGVYRIDPRTNRVISFIHLQPTPATITVAYGRVWVTEAKPGPGLVVRIDPQTDRVTGPPIRVGVGAARIVAGFGALWVTNGNENGSVSRINPATGAVTRTFMNIPEVVAAGAGSLWVSPNHGGIQRADPATGQVMATLRLPHAVNVTLWAGSAWVSEEPPGRIVRVDPASNHVIGKAVPAGTSPSYIAAAPSGLWVVDFTTGDLLHLAPRR